MTDADLDETLLREPNPFADPVARLDVGLPPPPDVETLHADVRAGLRKAILAAGGSGRAQMVVVTGDPGMGKTHELVRLQVEAQRAQQAFYFVDIPPLKDEGGVFRHLLRHFAQGLAGQDQLLRLLWESLRRVAAAVRAAAWRDADDALVARLDHVLLGGAQYVSAFAALVEEDHELGEILHRRGRALPPLSALSAEVGRVLCKLPVRDARAPIVEWLKAAELPDEDLAMIGVKTSLDGEARSFEALQALIKLCPTPVALCFDQLETTSAILGVHGLVTLFNALMEVYQQVPVCIVLMCQSQQWAELHGQLPRAAIERVQKVYALARPTALQAERLVAERLALVWAGAAGRPPYPTYPFPATWIDAFVRQARPTLRGVLKECGERLDEMARGVAVVEPGAADPPPDPTALSSAMRLGQEYARQTALVDSRSNLADAGQRQERLRSIVGQLFLAAAESAVAIGGVRVVSVALPVAPKRGAMPPMIVTVEGGRRIAVEVYNEGYAHIPLGRLAALVDAKGAETGVLLREASAALGKGDKTRDLMKRLGDGAVVWLQKDAVRRLVGGELLLDAVSAGELAGATRGQALEHLLAQPDLLAALAPVVGGGLEDPMAERIFAVVAQQGGTMPLARVAAELGVDEVILDPAVRQLTTRGRAMVQKGGPGKQMLVLMRGAR